MFELRTLLILIPALPLLSAMVTAVAGPRLLGSKSHVPTIVALALSFLCSLVVVWTTAIGAAASDGGRFESVHTLWTWAQVDDAYVMPTEGEGASDASPNRTGRPFSVDVTLRADGLTAMMLAMVTFIAWLVAIYSIGYMHGDRGYWRFFAYVSLFVFSMTMLVLVSNFLLLYVFWEAVGVCSYFLIGFWYEKEEAVAAGKKAFLVNRVGDFGFALALFLIWVTYGTLNFHDASGIAGVLGQQRLSGQAAFVGGSVGTAICLLLMLGACGKSAQFPLHVWLPDAMEGPTPVSALIHAATMVTAGVYMVARCAPLFAVSPASQVIVACVGGFTALLAGLIALTQFDLKRVLAYSTISQLGYMFLALGTGSLAGFTAGMFHLFTHAFFKALLFLGAGSVMHSMGNVIDIRRFSGLRRVLPWTHRTFLVGCLALAGVFPFAGFWSKDQVLAAVHTRAHAAAATSHGARPGALTETRGVVSGPTDAQTAAIPAGAAAIFGWLYWAALGTAFLTAFYTFRAYFLTFFGPRVVPEEAGRHAHESPPVMCLPLMVLAVGAFGVGFVFESGHALARFLATSPSLAYLQPPGEQHLGEFHLSIALISSAAALLGISAAAFLYLGDRREVESLARRLGPLRALSHHKFYFDELYQYAIVWPTRGLASVCAFLDHWLIDGLVDACGGFPVWLGSWLRRAQRGLIPYYSLVMILGTIAMLIVGKLLWGGG